MRQHLRRDALAIVDHVDRDAGSALDAGTQQNASAARDRIQRIQHEVRQRLSEQRLCTVDGRQPVGQFKFDPRIHLRVTARQRVHGADGGVDVGRLAGVASSTTAAGEVHEAASDLAAVVGEVIDQFQQPLGGVVGR
ncbi:MAG: hypothetical protein V3S31_08590 [Dehalococcoidia bacterium]